MRQDSTVVALYKQGLKFTVLKTARDNAKYDYNVPSFMDSPWSTESILSIVQHRETNLIWLLCPNAFYG